MNRKIFHLLVGLALLYMRPAFAGDIAGWRDARWGMTPHQVINVLGTLVRQPDRNRLCRDCPWDTLLELDNYVIAGQAFTVSFHFSKRDHRLIVVSLLANLLKGCEMPAAERDPAMRCPGYRPQFDAIRRLLLGKFGIPTSTLDYGESTAVEWARPSGEITLSIKTPEQDILSIFYESDRFLASLGESGKL
jgi:hypothetical protein